MAVFTAAFLYQFASARFSNDHFDHLSKAVQVLHGEYPVRDFLDPGRPLTIALSAVTTLWRRRPTLAGRRFSSMSLGRFSGCGPFVTGYRVWFPPRDGAQAALVRVTTVRYNAESGGSGASARRHRNRRGEGRSCQRDRDS
jgi:hypothetical protein